MLTISHRWRHFFVARYHVSSSAKTSLLMVGNTRRSFELGSFVLISVVVLDWLIY